MGVSVLTAMTIANNNVVAVSNGPAANGRFSGAIVFGDDHPNHPLIPIVSTNPIYVSADQAVEQMDLAIEEIRSNLKDLINPGVSK